MRNFSRAAHAALFLLTTFVVIFADEAIAQTSEEEQQVVLNAAQARFVARQALTQGNLPLAKALSDAVLAQTPDDAEMLMIRAILARQAGDLEMARDAGARAYRKTDNPALRFDAAMLVADLHARDENYTRSQIWLRRADQAAQNDRQRAVTANAYRQVTRLNPFSVQLRFGVRPSNNVNNGAETTVIELGGLPFRLDDSGQQLGGYEATAGVSLAYRLSESETQRTQALGELYFRKVWLDSAAKEASPASENSDFDYGTIIAGIRHQRLIWPETGPTSITALLGQSWYGGEKLARWTEVTANQIVQLEEGRGLSFGVNLRDETRLDSDINSSKALGLSVDYRQPVEGAGSWGAGLAVRNVWSDSATVDLFSTTLRADRNFGRVGPIEPTLRVSVENRNYHKWLSTPGGRQDRSLTIDVGATWPEAQYYGFVPQASVRGRRTWSNVDIYDRNELSFGMTLVSRF
ncbi:hypothetical protein GQ651_13105 [Alphaproteobacteria bacterium GH1-50]|uniref:Tetratricopeptide repeat protein n=1 Tax=Kangsaoukella pontilimi TaxID=2691042 RepID=A0A7C9IHL5_9RHOB|nr:tetratricopeptide repeat protein [Kangsaoukella pontilimi]MXQ08789.1 hypothetical protein [Kangsaoukella pontilimi]